MRYALKSETNTPYIQRGFASGVLCSLAVGILSVECLTIQGTSPPDPISQTDVTGSWLAFREDGEVCRLDLDLVRGGGEMVCASECRRFRTPVQSTQLKQSRLIVVLERGEILSGEIDNGRFSTTYGTRPMKFFKEAHTLAVLNELGYACVKGASETK
jgi:hypothetical protein